MEPGTSTSPLTGQCNCGHLQYTLARTPLFVHCCHCSWCRRETGSAFALNALIETQHLRVAGGVTESIHIPSNSGYGQTVHRCPACRVVLWSHYNAAKEKVAFVRVGTLHQPQLCPPDIHIYTTSKLPWVILDPAVPAMEEFYQRSKLWPAGSVERYRQCLGR